MGLSNAAKKEEERDYIYIYILGCSLFFISPYISLISLLRPNTLPIGVLRSLSCWSTKLTFNLFVHFFKKRRRRRWCVVLNFLKRSKISRKRHFIKKQHEGRQLGHLTYQLDAFESWNVSCSLTSLWQVATKNYQLANNLFIFLDEILFQIRWEEISFNSVY
jgi:hypothetical protein